MQSKISIALISLGALVIGIYFSGLGLNGPFSKQIDPAQIEGFFWPNQKQIVEFEMVDQDNQPFTLANFEEKWSFLFFGYTHCPDICPITMQTLRQAREQIVDQHPELAKKTEFVFVSVDGVRDTPSHLKTYLAFFGDYFTGATGTKTQIDSLTKQLGVPYVIEPHEEGSMNYLVEHSGAILLVSPRGMLAAIYQPPLKPESIAERFSQIMKFVGEV